MPGDTEAEAPPDGTRRFVIPVAGLGVPTAWQAGRALVRPGADALAELGALQTNDSIRSRLEEMFADDLATAFVEAEAETLDEAIDISSEVIDLLRVYQHASFWFTAMGTFGLTGDLMNGTLRYGQVVNESSGFGWQHRGPHLGWSFQAPDQWPPPSVFNRLGEVVGSEREEKGVQRAFVGIHYLSQALAEARPAFQMVSLVTALEAMLLRRGPGSQTYRLARAISFFGCGVQDDNLCGRSRETCTYLAQNPDEQRDRGVLKTLRRVGEQPPWRCSEWHRVVDWYDLRSDVVHGGGPKVDPDDAQSAVFWTLRYLTVPILTWLIDHPDDPIGDLDAALAALPAPPDWEARLGPLR